MTLRLIFLCLICGACNPKIIQYSNEKAHYKDFKTFYLVNSKEDHINSAQSEEVNSLLEPYLMEEMIRRDYRTDANNPDLILRYEIISSTEVTRNNNQQLYYYNPYPINRYNIRAVILLELIDAQTKKLVWQASEDIESSLRRRKEKDPLKGISIDLFNTYLYRAGDAEQDESLKIK